MTPQRVESEPPDPARARYRALQRSALDQGRLTDELLTLYVLEAFLRRLSKSPYRDRLVLKGGVLLAAIGDRRATRDVDLQARQLDNDVEATRAVVVEIAGLDIGDGLLFDSANAVTEVIRGGAGYHGARVRMPVHLASARLKFAVDVNFGEPVQPEARWVDVPALLATEDPVKVLGYPVEMVHAEKLVTALQRGPANTRWRDFADVWTLSRHRPCDGTGLQDALTAVGEHRRTPVTPLLPALDGYGDLAQPKWRMWRNKARLTPGPPESFADLLADLHRFSALPLSGGATGREWDPSTGKWV